MRKAWPILVVDDQPAFLEMLVDFLSHEGFAAIGASNGEDAIRQIEHNHFAVLIVDLKMTPIGGEQVIEVAKKQSNLTEIIVITGFPSLSSTVEAIRYQVFDYVTKPVDLERLLRMVENACEQYQLRRANEQILDQLNRQHEILQSRIKEVSEELEQLSTTDALTGLFNYRFFTEVIQTEISRAIRYERPLTLAMLDLDRFKHYNDTHGHQKGNEALRLISARMRASVREVDIVIRYGGEEFAILLPETPKESARTIVARVCQQVRDLNLELQTAEGPNIITLSCGLAACPEDAKDPESLVMASDMALYRAKTMGRNQIVFYTTALQEAEKQEP